MRGRKNPTTNQPPPNLPPCKVCGEQGTGFHYGVTTCGACKGFFRRSLVRCEPYVCIGTGHCRIGPETKRRKSCPKCRYNKCIAVGMCKEAIKTGRYSYVKKSQDIIEMIEHQIHHFGSPEQQCEIDVKSVQETEMPLEHTPLKNARSSCALEKSSSPAKLRSQEYMEVSPKKVDNCCRNVFQFDESATEYTGMLPNGHFEGANIADPVKAEDRLSCSDWGLSSNSSSPHQPFMSTELQPMTGMDHQLMTPEWTNELSRTCHPWEMLSPSSSPTFSGSPTSSPLVFPASPFNHSPPVGHTTADVDLGTPYMVEDFATENVYPFSQSTNSSPCNSDINMCMNAGSSYMPPINDFKKQDSQNIIDLKSSDPFFTSRCDTLYSDDNTFHNQGSVYCMTSNDKTGQVFHDFSSQNCSENNEHYNLTNYRYQCDENVAEVTTNDNNLLTSISQELGEMRDQSWEDWRTYCQSMDNRNISNTGAPNTESSSERIRETNHYGHTDSNLGFSHTDSPYNSTESKLYWDLDDKVSSSKEGPHSCETHSSGQCHSSGMRQTENTDGSYPLSNFTDFFYPSDSNTCPLSNSKTDLSHSKFFSSNTCSSSTFLCAESHNSGNLRYDVPITQTNRVNTDFPVEEKMRCESLGTEINKSCYNYSIASHSSYASADMTISGASFESDFINSPPCELQPIVSGTSSQSQHFTYTPQQTSPFTPPTGTPQKSDGSPEKFNNSQAKLIQEDLLSKWTPFKLSNESLRIPESDESQAETARLHEDDNDYHNKPLPWCEFTEAELDEVVLSLKTSFKKYVGVGSCQLTDDEISEKEDMFLKMVESKQVSGQLTALGREDYYRIWQVTGLDIGGMHEYHQAAATIMNRNLVKIILFFRSIPGFKDICHEDKIVLAREACQEYSVIGNFRGINAEKKTYLDAELRIAMSSDHLSAHYPELSRLMEDIYEVARKLKDLNLSFEEVLILKAISVSSPDRIQLKEFEKVYGIYWKLHCCLLLKFWRNCSMPLQKYARVISILTDLRDVHHRWREVTRLIRPYIMRMIQDIKVPLFIEIFMSV